jgi:hypothetical protein
MKGGTRKRGSTWTAYWFTIDPGTGKRKQHTKGGFRTQRAAQGHLNELVGKVQAQTWRPDKKMTVKELMVEWLAAKESEALVAGLRWEALDLDGATMRIVSTRVLVDGKPVVSTPKTEAGRRNVPLDPMLVGMLRTWKTRQRAEQLSVGEGYEQSGYVFTDEIGRPLNPEYFSTALDSLAKAAGLRRVRLHDLRHTAASLMLAAGEPVKGRLRIAGSCVTDHYAEHLRPRDAGYVRGGGGEAERCVAGLSRC